MFLRKLGQKEKLSFPLCFFFFFLGVGNNTRKKDLLLLEKKPENVFTKEAFLSTMRIKENTSSVHESKLILQLKTIKQK